MENAREIRICPILECIADWSVISNDYRDSMIVRELQQLYGNCNKYNIWVSVVDLCPTISGSIRIMLAE